MRWRFLRYFSSVWSLWSHSYILIISNSLSFLRRPVKMVGGGWDNKLYNVHIPPSQSTGFSWNVSETFPMISGCISSLHNGAGWAPASINIVIQPQRFIIVLKYFSVCEEIFSWKQVTNKSRISIDIYSAVISYCQTDKAI